MFSELGHDGQNSIKHWKTKIGITRPNIEKLLFGKSYCSKTDGHEWTDDKEDFHFAFAFYCETVNYLIEYFVQALFDDDAVANSLESLAGTLKAAKRQDRKYWTESAL